MLKIAIIGLGGCVGAILRYVVAGGVHTLANTASFPVGTMTVNIAGCLLIGIGGGLMESRQLFSPEWRAFLFVGILGSFTTFSTFGLETFNLKGSRATAADIHWGSEQIWPNPPLRMDCKAGAVPGHGRCHGAAGNSGVWRQQPHSYHQDSPTFRRHARGRGDYRF
ncbi:MAG: fluoride efflux transporter CrcB [Desulfosarcina sp.]|nr:fluoride efflux transporter CrcB [Desulfosarcina sp.]MBC2767589.1 fluoride efflux transporter CrcB [Desulfosarcina sp.]